MSDVKSVIGLLCKCINLLVKVSLKPEHFRLAKFNNSGKDVAKNFWMVLHSFSSHAASRRYCKINFEEYDTITATKLYFAYLQYPVLEFYGLVDNDDSNQDLLLAFAWLLSTEKVLDTVVRFKLITSILGGECTSPDILVEKAEINKSQSTCSQLNNILCLNNKVNYNIKGISELVRERAKLITKVHAASLNTSGLPHINVSELTIFKHFVENGGIANTPENERKLEQLREITNLLEIHMKWEQKKDIFFQWMVTVIQEHDKSIKNRRAEEMKWGEVAKFISLLRHIIKQELMKQDENGMGQIFSNAVIDCPSRLLKTQDKSGETRDWLAECSMHTNQIEREIQEMKEELSVELNSILKSIPSCVQIQRLI